MHRLLRKVHPPFGLLLPAHYLTASPFRMVTSCSLPHRLTFFMSPDTPPPHHPLPTRDSRWEPRRYRTEEFQGGVAGKASLLDSNPQPPALARSILYITPPTNSSTPIAKSNSKIPNRLSHLPLGPTYPLAPLPLFMSPLVLLIPCPSHPFRPSHTDTSAPPTHHLPLSRSHGRLPVSTCVRFVARELLAPRLALREHRPSVIMPWR